MGGLEQVSAPSGLLLADSISLTRLQILSFYKSTLTSILQACNLISALTSLPPSMNSATSSNEPTLQPTLVSDIRQTETNPYLSKLACLEYWITYRVLLDSVNYGTLFAAGTFVYADPLTGSGHWNDGKNWTLIG